ncbi:MAG: antitoxin [Spirochaetes bacterium]|nr:MAG: antitoxin [Spirochaetota bacterium]
MAILQVRDIDDRLYASLKTIAKSENRSISQEVISIIEKYLSNPMVYKNNPTKEFIALSGSWDDERNADAIIDSINKSRTGTKRFNAKDVIFD